MELLLPELKEELNITWDDEDTKLIRQLNQGAKAIQRMIGSTELDFMEDDKPKELLFNYVRYLRNHVIEYFNENFRDDLTSLSLELGAEALETETAGDLDV